jgi:hypothetical protein
MNFPVWDVAFGAGLLIAVVVILQSQSGISDA